mgnify:CR=1 FL=1
MEILEEMNSSTADVEYRRPAAAAKPECFDYAKEEDPSGTVSRTKTNQENKNDFLTNTTKQQVNSNEFSLDDDDDDDDECDDPDCACHHHHDDDDDDEHEHHHHHHHHHGHDADEVFISWGEETHKKFTKAEIERILKALGDTDAYGIVLRAKGYVANAEGEKWIHFDYVPGEPDIRDGGAMVTGRICVIGSKLNEEAVAKLFGVEKQ